MKWKCTQNVFLSLFSTFIKCGLFQLIFLSGSRLKFSRAEPVIRFLEVMKVRIWSFRTRIFLLGINILFFWKSNKSNFSSIIKTWHFYECKINSLGLLVNYMCFQHNTPTASKKWQKWENMGYLLIIESWLGCFWV